MMLFRQKSVRPARRGNQRHPPRAIPQRPGHRRPHFHTPLGRRPRRVKLLPILHRAAPIADNLAPVAVHQKRHHRIVKPLPVIVQIQQRIQDSVAQPALFVQRLIGIRHINPLLQQPPHQTPRRRLLPGILESLIRRLIPHIHPRLPVLQPKGLALHLLVRQHTERRNNVLLEILVLVIPPDDHKIRLKSVNLRP